MTNLDTQIEQWRRQLSAGTRLDAEVFDELEAHLRDDVDAQVAAGASAPQAFQASLAHLGTPELLKQEFDKVGATARRPMKNFFLTLAGIPPSHPANAMNMTCPSSDLEPRWASYTKAALFIAPAIVLWTFSVMYLVPKLQKICMEAGVTLPWLYDVTSFMADHLWFVLALVAAPFALLEWRWERWSQFRRVSLGGVVFVMNATVLALITLIAIFALYAAPGLMGK